MHKNQLGVSVIVCCHNSKLRLAPTLAHLASQQMTNKIVSWEVIIIDNASTDGTAEFAMEQWPKEHPTSLRVVREPKAGLTFARLRGLSEARFELVSFIDDDNWVCPEWVETIAELMEQYPNIGACGGRNEAISDMHFPIWFDSYQENYAIGEQGVKSGDVTFTRGYLWGAGLNIRKEAWQQLLDAGFDLSLTDRLGTALSSGGDSEICYALRLAGWHLWYDRRLKLKHFLPAQRLEWQYLRRLYQSQGSSLVVLGIYLQVLFSDQRFARIKQCWSIQVVGCLVCFILTCSKGLVVSGDYAKAGKNILLRDYYQGKLTALFQKRKDYIDIRERIQTLANAFENA